MVLTSFLLLGDNPKRYKALSEGRGGFTALGVLMGDLLGAAVTLCSLVMFLCLGFLSLLFSYVLGKLLLGF